MPAFANEFDDPAFLSPSVDFQRRSALFPDSPGLLAYHAEEAARRRPQHSGDLCGLEPPRAADGRVRLW